MINEQKKMTVSDSSAKHTELLSSPGPLAKELQYVGADAKQSLCKNNEIISNQKQVGNLQTVNNIEKSSALVNAGVEGLDAKSLVEILDTTFPPQIPLIEDFLYTGTYLFAGAPKLGKSFFMAQIGFHISTGTPIWNHAVHKGAVLYLALEDNFSRIQKRLSKMFDMADTDNFFFAIESKSLKEGLDLQMENFIKEHPDTKLVIIDTLQKIREVGGDKYSYASDYEIITKLKSFGDKYNIGVLVVHHTRKMESSDAFDMISGTQGLLGAADGAFIMQKEKRTENKAILDISGRDQQDQKLHLKFDVERCLWELEKSETELWKAPPDPLLEAVSRVLTLENPKWEGTATELVALLDGVEIAANVITRKLNVKADELYNKYHIRFASDHPHGQRRIILQLVEEE